MSSGVGERQSIALPWAEEGCVHVPVPARVAQERMREVLAQRGWPRLNC